MKKTLLYLALVLALSACDKGSPFDNKLPDTQISLEAINLVGEDRLRSEVELNWLGSDVDGYVIGYEFSFDNTNWVFTEGTDSTFNFSLPVGIDTNDINFYVRSIDNDEGVDPTPAYLQVPIRNTAPISLFDSVNVVPDTSYVITTAFFDIEDLDGDENLDSVYLKINNGPWYNLPPDTRIVTLVPDDPQATGNVNAQVLVGTGANALSDPIQGLNLEGDNIMYLRARDIAGSDSETDTSKVFFVRNQTSDLLVVKAHASGGSTTPEQVLLPEISNVYGGYDFIDLFSNDGLNKPNLWTPTFSLFIELYDKIFWYSGAGEDEFGILEEASGAVQEYLNSGGKLMVSTGFPSTFDNSSVVLEFTPVDSISTSPGQARLPTNNRVYPTPDFITTYDSLAASEFIAGSTPIYVSQTGESMYKGILQISGGWVGPDDFGARSTNGDNNANVIFFSIELHRLNGISGSLTTLFDEVLNNEFNW